MTLMKTILQNLNDVENNEYISAPKVPEDTHWTKLTVMQSDVTNTRRVTIKSQEGQTGAQIKEQWNTMTRWLIDNVGSPALIEVNEFGDVIESEFVGNGWEIDFSFFNKEWVIHFDKDRDASMFLIRWS